jgi:Ca2+-binding RTX toxin-like protein
MSAAYERAGAPILVNTQTVGSQFGGRMVRTPSGGLLVIWNDAPNPGPGEPHALRAQYFNAAMQPVGGEFQLASFTTEYRGPPALGMFADGRFVVVFSRLGAPGDTSSNGLVVQLFNPDGSAIGAQFTVNQNFPSLQIEPEVAILPGGNFVIVWEDFSGDGSSVAVKARMFGPDGAPTGNEFLVNSQTVNVQSMPAIQALAGGGFAIVWADRSGSRPADIKLQFFDSVGVRTGPEITVNETTIGHQSRPTLTQLGNGNVVVAWADFSESSDQSKSQIRGQLFDSGGIRLGHEFHVGGAAGRDATIPQIISLSDGGFIVAWRKALTDLEAQFFDSAGNKLGRSFIVPAESSGDQYYGELLELSSGLVALYTDTSRTGGDSSESAVRMQLLSAGASPPTDIALSHLALSETTFDNLPVAVLSGVGALNGLVYSIVSDSTGGAFKIEENLLLVADNLLLDHEKSAIVQLRLRATDTSGQIYEEAFELSIEDTAFEARYSAGDISRLHADKAGFNTLLELVPLPGGGFIAITAYLNLNPTTVSDLRARVFDGNGTPLADEFSVNVGNGGSSIGFSATALTANTFLVVSEGRDLNSSGASFPLVGRIFTLGGSPVSELFEINSDAHSIVESSAVPLQSGFVVAWQSFGAELLAQLFDANGSKIGVPFQINSVAEAAQHVPRLTALPDGGFAATWIDHGAIGVKAQIFDPAGRKVGGEIAVRAEPVIGRTEVITLKDGSILIAWGELVAETDEVNFYDIKAQRVSPSGVLIGAIVEVAPIGLADQGLSIGLAATDDGGYAVSWSTISPITLNLDDLDSYAQLFTADGERSGDVFVVSGTTASIEGGVRSAALASGDIVFGWYDAYVEQGFYTSDSYARIFATKASTQPSEAADRLTGTTSTDTFDGHGGADVFFMQQGGDDRVSGGSGNDGFYFGASFTGADRVDGGAGDDQLALQGAYALTIGAASMVGVETLALLSGSDTRFGESGANRYDYALTSHDGNVAAGQVLTVQANGLLAGEDLTFDGSAETDGSFAFFAGAGADVLTGGAQSDGFFFGEGRFDPAADRVNGGAGADDQLGLRGNFAAQLVFGADTMRAIETIALISATDARFGAPGETFRYNILSHNDNVAAGARLTVNGGGLAAGETLVFNGSNEADGSFRLIGGAGGDSLIGGAGADELFGGLGGDFLVGLGGADRFVYTDAAQSRAGASDLLAEFDADDVIDLAAIDAVAGGADDAFTFIGSAAFTAAGQVRLVQDGAAWRLEANVDADLGADLVIGISTTGGYVPGAGDLAL